MMIITEKLTSLAFAYYDGMRPEDKLTADQKSQAIRYFLCHRFYDKTWFN